jgi:hypothetical protein
MTASRRTVLALLAFLSGLANGQTGSSPGNSTVRILGRITDQTGAQISNATVKFKVAALDVTPIVVHTVQDGTFAFRTEPLRKYELAVEMAGFKTTIKTIDVGTDKEFNAGDIVMLVGDPGIVDWVMDYGVTTEDSARLTIHGIGGSSATLSVSDLSKLPQKTVKAMDHGTRATFQGVLLTDVLKRVDLPSGEEFHSTGASYYLTAEAKDGYEVVFAWAELDSTFINKSVYVVTKRDGKPLPDNDGPFQLLVPGERRSARWVRQVTVLKIQQAN